MRRFSPIPWPQSRIAAYGLALLAIAPSHPALADEADEETSVVVVVTGRRAEEAPSESPRSVSVLDEARIARTAPRTLPEALWELPGVFVQQTNHGGGSPIVRGMVGPQVLILVDGVRLNNSVYRTGPVQYLNLVDPFSLERVEVLRGPGSVLYGSDAMGGVIHVFPREPVLGRAEPFTAGAMRLQYASADEGRSLGARAGIASRCAGLEVSASQRLYDDLLGGGDLGVQPFTAHEQTNAHVVARASTVDGHLQGKIAWVYGRIEDAGRTDKLKDGSLQIHDNDDHLAYGRIAAEIPLLRTVASYTLSWQWFHEVKDTHSLDEDLVGIRATTREEVRVGTLGHDLAAETTIRSDRARLRYGALWYRDRVDAETRLRTAADPWANAAWDAYPAGSTYDSTGVYALFEAEPVVTAGGRRLGVDVGYRANGMAGTAPAQGDLEAVRIAELGHVVHGRLQFTVRDEATVAATFSQGVRAPNLQEAVMLGDTGKFFHVPNDDLGAERSDTLELLARGRVGRARLEGAAYVSFLEDLVKRGETTWQGLEEVGGKPVAYNFNGGSGLIWGLEPGLRVDLGGGFALSGALAWTWGVEFFPDAEDVPLTRIPPLFGTASLGRSGDRGWAEIRFRAAAKQPRLSAEDATDPRIPEGGTPGWWTADLVAGVRVAPNLRAFLVVENLPDNAYKYHGSGVHAAGTNTVAGLEAGF